MEEILNFQGNCLYKTSTNHQLTKKEKEYFSTLKFINKGGLYISTDRFILDKIEFEELSKFFDLQVKNYMVNYLQINNSLKRTNSWITINKPNSSHHAHIHPNTFISVCFYPKLKSGDIKFTLPHNPLNKGFNFAYDIISPNIFNAESIGFYLQEGDVVIFPGWVMHESTPNLSEENRIMIGANYFLTGVLGSEEKIDYLKL